MTMHEVAIVDSFLSSSSTNISCMGIWTCRYVSQTSSWSDVCCSTMRCYYFVDPHPTPGTKSGVISGVHITTSVCVQPPNCQSLPAIQGSGDRCAHRTHQRLLEQAEYQAQTNEGMSPPPAYVILG